MIIRSILKEDNKPIANLIRKVLEEHKANLPGTAYYDKHLYSLSEVYKKANSEYFVIEIDNKVIGGAGIAALDEENKEICELQKIYLSSDLRGKGLGKLLIEKCLKFAKEKGYQKCYLETMPQLSNGIKLYEKVGFERLDKPIGNTMHHGCTIWMIKEL